MSLNWAILLQPLIAALIKKIIDAILKKIDEDKFGEAMVIFSQFIVIDEDDDRKVAQKLADIVKTMIA